MGDVMKNKFKVLIAGLLIAITARGDVIQNDLLKVGKASSSADKVFEFETNDGVNNKKLKLITSTNNASFNVNELTTGDGTAGDKKWIMDVGAGASNPRFQWTNSTSRLQFSNDGTNFKNIGSGSGGAAGFNLLADDNPDFEAGTGSWTATGLSFSAISSGQAFGLQGGRFNASAASQTLSSALKSVVDGLKNQGGTASCYFKTTATDYKMQVYDGTNVLAETLIAPTADYTKQSMVYTHPASGSVRLRIISGSNAADIDIDNCFLGELERTSMSQAELIGTLMYSNAASCEWFTPATASDTMENFTADTDCAAPTVTGSASAPGTKIPGITFASLSPGKYVVEVSAILGFQTPTGNDAFLNYKIHDGTSLLIGGSHAQAQNTGSIQRYNGGQFSGYTQYSTGQSNVTFQVQASTSDNANAPFIFNSQANQSFVMKVYKYPLVSQDTLTFDTINWKIDANMGGANPGLSLVDEATYIGISDTGLDLVVNTSKGSAAAFQACSGTEVASGATCTAAESVGISFVVPRAGTVKACLDFPWSVNLGASSSAAATFQLVETANNDATTILQEGGSRVQNFLGNGTGGGAIGHPNRTCGTFKFDGSGQKTIRLFYEVDYGGTVVSSNVIADRAAANGQEDMKWTVEYIDQQVPAPLLPNIIVSNSTAATRSEFARIQNTGAACVITSQSGAWLTSATRTGTGKCQLAIVSGMFSATPSCQVTAEEPTSAIYAFIVADTAPSPTNVHIGSSDAAGSFTDSSNFSVHCSGLK